MCNEQKAINIEAVEALNESIINNRSEYIKNLTEAYTKGIKGEKKSSQVSKLIRYLDEHNFFESPASTKYHGNKRGYLATHSLNVMKMAINLALTLGYKDLDKVRLASLLHDIGKTGQFGKIGYLENRLKSGEISEKKPFEINKELLNVPHEIRSIQIASMFLDLEEDVSHAMLYHNGLYGPLKYEIQNNETELYMIVHWADMWASKVLED